MGRYRPYIFLASFLISSQWAILVWHFDTGNRSALALTLALTLIVTGLLILLLKLREEEVFHD